VPADSGVNFAHFVEVARIAERGLFDMLFFADQAAIFNDTPDNLSRNSYMVRIEPFKHAKLMYNAAISPLAASAGMPFMAAQTALGTDIHNPNYDMPGRAGLRDGTNGKIPRKKYCAYDQRSILQSRLCDVEG
jgi:hypothetical protein